MDGLQLENRTQVILWLRENYKHATTTSVSKRSVFAHYLDACKKQNVLTPISHTYFGKLVRKAFPDVRCNRKGPRGSAQQHYRLIRADGGDADEFLSALGDEHDDVHVDYDDEEDEFAAKSAAKRKKANGKKKAKTAAALRKNGVSRPTSRARAAATAAASTISRMINADQAPANLTEAWSFSSAPSSPSFSMASSQHGGAESIPSSPGAQSSSSEYEQEEQLPVVELEDVIEEEVLDEGHEEVFQQQQQRQNEEDLDEDDDYEDELDEEEQADEEQVEEEVDEQDEEEDEQAEEDEVEEFNFDLPQFEITPGEESPGTSFSYEACPPLSGHDQNLRLQQQLLLSSSSGSSVQQQQASCFEPSAFYDFVSPDLEMPLSAINQVANLAEDFGWSMPSMPSAVDRCHMAAAAYGSHSAMMQQHQQQQQRYAYQQQQVQQQQQQQSSGVLSFLLSEQVPATQCSDLAEWVAHYCI